MHLKWATLHLHKFSYCQIMCKSAENSYMYSHVYNYNKWIWHIWIPTSFLLQQKFHPRTIWTELNFSCKIFKSATEQQINTGASLVTGDSQTTDLQRQIFVWQSLQQSPVNRYTQHDSLHHVLIHTHSTTHLTILQVHWETKSMSKCTSKSTERQSQCWSARPSPLRDEVNVQVHVHVH